MKKTAFILSIVMLLALLPTGALAANDSYATYETGNTFYAGMNDVDPERITKGYIDIYGDLYMWGDNSRGQVGNGTSEYQETPCLVLSHVISFHCGGPFSTALTENGDLYAWGSAGVVGNSGSGNSYVWEDYPQFNAYNVKVAIQDKPLKILENVKYYGHNYPDAVFAITKDGDLYAWGSNECGQLGNGNVDFAYYPQKILSSVKKVTMYYGTCIYATTNEGDYFWGTYEYGKTGHEFPDGVQTAVVQSYGGEETDVITAPAPVKLLNPPEPIGPQKGIQKDGIQIPCGKNLQTTEAWLNGQITTVRKNFLDWQDIDEYRLAMNGSLYKSGKPDKFIMRNVETYAGFGDIAYLLNKDGTAYMYKATDNSLTKLAENVAMPYSTITEDPYLRSLDSDTWYYEYMKYVYTEKMTEGIPPEDFEPGRNLTRAMLLQMLYNLDGHPKMDTPSYYDDVSENDWFYDATIWGTDNKIINGYGNGTFGPNDPILREQMVAILYRYANYKNVTSSKRDDLSVFTDKGRVSAYAVDAMQWSVAEGIINGTTPTTIAPHGNSNCAQVSAMVKRYCENIL